MNEWTNGRKHSNCFFSQNSPLQIILARQKKFPILWSTQMKSFKRYSTSELRQYWKELQLPNCLNNKRTEQLVTGMLEERGGWSACLSPAPMEKRTWGPPGGGTNMQPNILPTSVSIWTWKGERGDGNAEGGEREGGEKNSPRSQKGGELGRDKEKTRYPLVSVW